MMAMLMTMAHHVRTFISDFVPLARDAASITITACKVYFRVFAYLVQPLIILFLHLYTIIMPPLANLVRNVALTMTMQPRRIVIMELSSISALILIISIERRFRLLRRVVVSYRTTSAHLTRRYRRFLAQVRAKSRLAAAALPHLIFTSGAVAFHYFFARYANAWLRTLGLFLTAFVWPTLRTLRLLYTYNNISPLLLNNSITIHDDINNNNTSHNINTPNNNRNPALLSSTTSDSLNTPRSSSTSSTSITSSETTFQTPQQTATTTTTTTSSGFSIFSSLTPALRSAPPGAEVIRRRKRLGTIARESDDLRHRAARVAEDIENDSDNANTLSSNNNAMISASTITPARTSRPLFRYTDDDEDNSNNSNGYRASMTLTAPRARRMSPHLSEEVARLRAERRVLRFWIVFGIAWVLRSLIWFLCPQLLSRVLDTTDIWLFYLVCWAQLGLTNGADILYSPLTKFLHKKGLVTRAARRVASRMRARASVFNPYVSDNDDDNDDDDDDVYFTNEGHDDERKKENGCLSSSSSSYAGTNEQLGLLLRIASTLRLTDALKSGRLWRFILDSGLALVFFFLFTMTPRPLTFIATLIAGILIPSMRSTTVLESLDTPHNNNKHKNNNNNGHMDDAMKRRQDWLMYWSAYALLEFVYTLLAKQLSWLPLWFHVKMAVILWLQIPDFHGAVRVLDWVMLRIGFVLASVKQRSVLSTTPGKRKRS